MQSQDRLSNREKALIGVASAMGAGCRTCAERLVPMAEAAGATPEDIEAALVGGLAGRATATETMRRKASSLLGRDVDPEVRCTLGDTRIDELVRMGAAAAANSSPDALSGLRASRSAGATDAELATALAIARKVRSKAQGFSDQEIEDAHRASEQHRANDPGVLCCSGHPGS